MTQCESFIWLGFGEGFNFIQSLLQNCFWTIRLVRFWKSTKLTKVFAQQKIYTIFPNHMPHAFDHKTIIIAIAENFTKQFSILSNGIQFIFWHKVAPKTFNRFNWTYWKLWKKKGGKFTRLQHFTQRDVSLPCLWFMEVWSAFE